MNIAAIGRQSFADTLAGKLSHCDVSEWLDDSGNPVKVYWKPLTGNEQKSIESFDNSVDRILMSIKVRARDSEGKLIFESTPIESLRSQYDYNVMRAIGYLMATDMGNDTDETIEALEKE